MTTPENNETARKILDAALALWSEKGYAASTMRELARRTGMGVSSLYFYFRSKEEIVQFLYREINQKARARFKHEDKGDTDLGRELERFLTIKLALLAPHRSCLAAILRDAIDPESAISPMSPDSSRVLGDSLEFFQELVLRGKAAKGEELGLARMLWMGHLGVLLYWLHDRSEGSKNTGTLVHKMASATAMLPMLKLLPGSGELMRLVSELFRAAPAAAAGATEADEAAAREVDVVVIGAGPIGIVAASFLKRARPRTRILVLDRAIEPGHKIGESTLSGFVKAIQTLGIRHEVLRQLFYPKNGLAFFHVDASVPDITKAPEYVLETFDETYQVERRVLDSLLIANARRIGIQVVQGAKVDLERSTFSAKGDLLTWKVGKRDFRARASLVIDASGPASALAQARGLRTDEGVPFQTSSVWTYFSDVKPLASLTGWRGRSQFPRDQYTVHLCFKEGWLWYIPVVSWQGAPAANLGQAFDTLLRAGRNVPTREQLCEEFACPAETIVSFGVSLRSDRDDRIKDDPRGAFEHYRKKYPAIGRILDGATSVDPYGERFMSRSHYRSHARAVAGDGWMLVGDAAFFVDPLISPGLTGGTACAWHVAAAAAKALDSGIFAGDSLGEYAAFASRLHEALERDNELVYMSFNHPETLALVQRFQEIDARRHFLANASQEYGVSDTNVWGILDSTYLEAQKAAWSLLREEEAAVGREVPVEEQSSRDYERAVKRLRTLLGEYVDDHADLTPYVKQNEARG